MCRSVRACAVDWRARRAHMRHGLGMTLLLKRPRGMHGARHAHGCAEGFCSRTHELVKGGQRQIRPANLIAVCIDQAPPVTGKAKPTDLPILINFPPGAGRRLARGVQARACVPPPTLLHLMHRPHCTAVVQRQRRLDLQEAVQDAQDCDLSRAPLRQVWHVLATLKYI
jgi:hypothetical protein